MYWHVGNRQAEPVKQFETLSYEAFCPSSSSLTGSVIHVMVGSLGGSGLRWQNRAGLVAQAASRFRLRCARTSCAVP